MSDRRPREGSLLRIDLGTGFDAFGRVLANSQLAAYSYLAQHSAELSPSQVYGSRVLFIVTVVKSALVSGVWPVVDYRALEPQLLLPVEYFQRDRLSGKYSIYRSSDGSSRPSSYEECRNLESAAVWEAEHVESRLRDHFAGRPNPWTEQLKAIP